MVTPAAKTAMTVPASAAGPIAPPAPCSSALAAPAHTVTPPHGVAPRVPDPLVTSGRSTRHGGLGAGLYAASAMAGVLGYTLRHRAKPDGSGSYIDIVMPAHSAPTNPA